MKQTWDIFCTVVDNFGDIGVCWRLARQLSVEHAVKVRLWLDDLNALAAIWPEVDGQADEQLISHIDVMRWHSAIDWRRVGVADVVIESFACRLPEAYMAAMLAKKQADGQQPRWVNLEYLSAEAWIDGCHGLSSPQNNGLVKQYFFPGFTEKSGGLLREKGLLRKRQQQTQAQPDTWCDLTRFDTSEQALKISLFAYDDMPLLPWLKALAESERTVQLAVTAGKATKAVQSACAILHVPESGMGSLTIRYLPMLSQLAFDTLLWAADVNFIRGEDSFIRAIWAGKPMVWHIYPQDDGVHFDKLNAFAERYAQDCSPEAAKAWRDFQSVWNGEIEANVSEAWANFYAQLDALNLQATRYAENLARYDDLAQQLVNQNTKPLA